ncbi:HAMP domain-containing protein [Caulobacter segnis]|uniref:histidine kinase n=2 Tax=Caulobacter segnis TaxID=88688 RepID=D5VF26_CAUST|nr:HWE histidine kinase domain-containing protein [Caulobacter segnis]ADG09444.1 signal transduction histidine kinase [Caulobacter segnis ATCC 21756]AVQ01241.1 HAMP domain-containing protein [Caulobacter segnis]
MAQRDRGDLDGRRRVSTVRGRLVLLTVSLLIPAIVSMVLLLAGADRESRGQLYQQLVTTARALSGAVDRQAAVGVAVVETLASDQALINGDWADFHTRAQRAIQRRPGWIVVSDIHGQQILNTLKPYGSPLPVSTRANELTSALLAGRSKISDLRQGKVARKPVITVATPILVKGEPYVLSYVVESASFTSVFRQQRVPDRWVATLLDNNRRVIARSRLNEKFTGALASKDMEENLRHSTEGVNKSQSLEGVPTMVAYTRSPQTGWTLVVAIPRDDLASTVNRSVVMAGAVFLLLLVLGITLSLAYARRINGEMRRLVSDAAAIGRGETLPSSDPDSLEEIAAVHSALREASRELKTREERQVVMINELNHRVKNTLATVQALARQTFLKTEGAPVDVFTERLIALSGAHDLLTKTGWREADMDQLVQKALGAHSGRVRREGPTVALAPHTAVGLSMVFHELATNSAKYGALSAPGGTVEVTWRLDPVTGNLAFTWRDVGGPPVSPPKARGFGTRLIESSIRREQKGHARFDFHPDGLVFEASLPLPETVRWANPF